jgi:hypothetical protein
MADDLIRHEGPSCVKTGETKEHHNGYLERGTWVDQWYDTDTSRGRFVRQDSRFQGAVGSGWRLFARSGTLSPLCFMGLSMGAPDIDLPRSQGS